MNKIKNNSKGITLIALIITIIVMLILVSVTITMAVNGGLFDYARKAASETENARDAEQELANLEANMTVDELIDKYTNAEKIPEGMVAKIGTNYYGTLQEAINVASDNTQTTIVLLKDITESVSVASGKNIVLNLNNKKISGNSESLLDGAICVEENAIISLNNGMIYTGSQNLSECLYNDGGKIILNNVFLESKEYGYTIYNSGELELHSVRITTEYAGIGNSGQLLLDGEVFIKCVGEIFTPINNNGTVTISKTAVFTCEGPYVDENYTIPGGTVIDNRDIINSTTP